MPTIAQPGSPEKRQESRDAQKVLRLLAKKVRSFGFERTKPTFFTRSSQHVLEFVHVHKFTFAPSFRVHFGVRVRSETFPAAHLNGPSSDEILDPELPSRRRYRFEFGTEEESWEECAQEMYQCVATEGLQWFESMNDRDKLLSPASPLTANSKEALRVELQNPGAVQTSEATQRALNAA
jgi:hypothetical protein